MASRYLEDDAGGTYLNPDYVDAEANPGDQKALDLQSAGWIPASGWTGDQVNWQHMQGGGGIQHADEKAYNDWLYGPGGTYQDIGGEMYYMPPGGMGSFLPGRSPLVNNSPDSPMGNLVLAGLLAMAGGAAFGGLGGVGAEGAAGLGADAAWGVNATGGAGEFGLAGGTAGNLAGTGGLSSAAGIHGLGAGVGAGGVGLGTGAAGAAAAGMGSSALLTPALAGAAGLATGGASAPTLTGGAATGGAATAPAAGTALSRAMDGTATAADWASLGGTGLSTLLGMYGADQQGDAYGDVASQYLALGAPSRARLEASYAPGFSMANEPGYQDALDLAANSSARAMSAKVGNPVENPGAYGEIQKYVTQSTALPQLNTYRSQNLSGGGLGVNTAGTASTAEAGQTGSLYNALGYGVGSLTQPESPYKSLYEQMMKKSLSTGFGF